MRVYTYGPIRKRCRKLVGLGHFLSSELFSLSLLSNVFSRHKSTSFQSAITSHRVQQREKTTYTWSRGDIIHAGTMIAKYIERGLRYERLENDIL